MIRTVMDDTLGLLRGMVEDSAEFDHITMLLEAYFDVLGVPTERDVKDANAMATIKRELFTYEKKYVPLIAENVHVSQKLRPNTLVMTVGLQPEPVILSILCLKPKNVFLLHTEDSLNQVSTIKQDEDIINAGVKISCNKITEYEVDENYRVMKDIIGKVSKSMAVDPTGGTKMMVASISLAAFYYKLPMIYMHSEQIKKQVVPFSDRVRIIANPLSTFGDSDLSLIETLFNSHMYEAAVKVCNDLLNSVRDAELAKEYELLSRLLSIYRDWDAFKHSDPEKDPNLSKELEHTISEMTRFELSRWLPENVQNNDQFLKDMESKYKNGSFNMVDEYRLVDIYLSALRRGSEKQSKYDDAIARLYRCIDMCATYVLKTKYDIESTEYPNYKKVGKKIGKSVEEIKMDFQETYKIDLPDERLGLDVQMKLLALLDPTNIVPKIYRDMMKTMRMRNYSILAHGTKPLTEREWQILRDKTLLMIKAAIGTTTFEEIYNMGFHGKISLQP